MLSYQQAIANALERHKKGEVGKTIPEELFTAVHPKTLYEEMPDVLDNCEEIQRQVLQEILYLAQGSVYGEERGLAQVTTLDEWRKIVPITTYPDYEKYIETEMNGTKHQLYNRDTTMVIATTGSTGKMKYLLESEAGNAAKQLIMTVRGMYMAELLPVTLDMEAKNLTISNYTPVGNSKDGTMIVRASGQTARNMRKKTGTMNLLPVEFWESYGISAWDRDYMMAVYTLAEIRFSKVFCNNVIHFGRILRRIKNEGAQMIDDIRRGYFSVEMPDEVRTTLAETFQANPSRAELLQHIFDRQGALITCPKDIREIWPNFCMISCWMSGTVGRDAREVIQQLPHDIKCFEMGYGASESKINIPTKLASASGAAAPFACFYEFLPLDGGEPVCLWEVEDGKHYELILTTYSGLYRYNMLDVVKIDGFIGKTPNLIFCGKSTDFIQINGQKLYGHQFADIVHEVEQEEKIIFDIVQMVNNEEGIYYILETKKKDVDFAAIKQKLDKLSEASLGVTAQGIYVMSEEYKYRLFTEATRIDRGASGIKLPVVIAAAPVQDVLAIVK